MIVIKILEVTPKKSSADIFKSSADVIILGVLQIGIRATVIENQVFWTLDYNYTFKTDHFYKIPPYALRAYAFPTSGRDITFTWFLIYVNMLWLC